MSKKIAFIFFVLISGISARAQDSLSLPELVELSLQNNFDIRISKLNEEKAQEQNAWGNAGFLPKINLLVTDRYSISNRDNPTSFVNGRITANNFNPSIELNQTLFNGFYAQATKKTYDLLQERSLNNTSIVVSNNLKAIYLLYYQVQAQYEVLSFQKENLELSNDLYQYNYKKWEQGIVTTNELQTYETFLLEDSLSILNTHSTIKQLISDLEKVTQLENLKLQKETFKYTFSEVGQLDSLYSLLKENPNMKSVLINEKIKEQELRQAKASFYPNLSMNLGYGNTFSNTSIEGLGSAKGTISDFYIGFSLGFNVFDGFKNRTKVSISKIDQSIANLETKKQESDLKNTLSKYYEQFNVSQEKMNLASRLTAISNSTLNYWVKKEQVGVITSLDLRDYQKTVIRNKQAELSSWLEAYGNRLEIQSIVHPLFQETFVE